MSQESIAALPPSLRALLAPLIVVFGPRNFENFLTAMVGWILARGGHTISGALRAQGPGVVRKHHSAFYDFFARANWAPDFVGETLFRLLLPRLPSRIQPLIDDTLCAKSGPHIWGAGMHHDSAASTYGRFGAAARHVAFAFGHNFVVLSVWIPLPWNATGIALPLLFRLYRSKKLTPGAEYRKRTELAAGLLEIFVGWCEYYQVGKRILLMADSEYACQTLLKKRPAGVDFIGPLSKRAALHDRPPPRAPGTRGARRKKGERLPSLKAWAEDGTPWKEAKIPMYGKRVTILIKTLVCLWYTVTGEQAVRVVLTRDPSRRLEDRAFFCTDPSMTPRDMLATYSHRWTLEVTFYNCKQFLGLEDPQNGWWRREPGTPEPAKKAGPNPKGNRGRLAAERTVPAIFFTYCLAYLWYLDHGRPEADTARAKLAAPWYVAKSAPSFADILAALRWAILAGRIDADPDLKRVHEKIDGVLGEQLRAA